MNRLLSETPDAAAFPGGAAITFTYTDNGQRATMMDENGLTTFTYDERDRLLSKATPDGTLVYTYDAAGNLLSTTSSNVNGVAVSYQYDVLNRLSAAGDENFTPPATHTYGYDAVGNLDNVVYANGVTHFWSYDNRNRLENLVVTDVSDIAIASFNYALDLVGNRTQMAELSGRVVDYAYDKLYRLTDEVISSGVGPTGAVNYQYDAVGNRLNRTSTLAGQTNQAFGYDDNDRILTDTFDNNGNTIASDDNTDEYDFKNRLVRRTKTDGTTIDIIYDGGGNRVAKTVTPLGGPSVTTKYLVDTNNLTGFAQVFEEIENGTVVSVYTYALDLISIDQDVGGQFEISYYLYDGLGSVRGLTDLNSNLTDTYTYDAFGNPLTVTGLTPNNYRFTGEQLDPNLGLYFLRARYLNTQTGRFHTLDTFGGRRGEPFSLHKYLYANANPVMFIDPSGKLQLSEISGALNLAVRFTARLAKPVIRLGRKVFNKYGKFIAKRCANIRDLYKAAQLSAKAFPSKLPGQSLSFYEIGRSFKIAEAEGRRFYLLIKCDRFMKFHPDPKRRPKRPLKVVIRGHEIALREANKSIDNYNKKIRLLSILN